MPNTHTLVPALQVPVLAVHSDGAHRFSKTTVPHIDLLAGLGVQGDAHCGRTVQHRSRVKANPDQPNLRQVHLISASLFTHLRTLGFDVQAGLLGENITLAASAQLDWQALIALPQHTQLHVGQGAVLQLTGLRNPCPQIEAWQPGLLAAMLGSTPEGQLLRKTGVMAIVLQAGRVQAQDTVNIILPSAPHHPMERV
jgi:MOSC domain-containing protein YiiM